MTDVELLLDDLEQITTQLLLKIHENDIEQSTVLVEQQLVLLKQIEKISLENPEIKKRIHLITSNLHALEKKAISEIEEQKLQVSNSLRDLNRLNKAKKAYFSVPKE